MLRTLTHLFFRKTPAFLRELPTVTVMQRPRMTPRPTTRRPLERVMVPPSAAVMVIAVGSPDIPRPTPAPGGTVLPPPVAELLRPELIAHHQEGRRLLASTAAAAAAAAAAAGR